MSTAGGPRLAGIGRGGDSNLALCLDCTLAASYPGDPVTNIYGDISGSSGIRPNRTEYNTSAGWRSVAGVPMCPDPTIGRIDKHTSGALSSTWAGNSYGYTLKDLATDSGSTYILTCWVYISEDCDITNLPCSIEGATSTSNVSNYPQSYEMDRKGTWQLLAKACVADSNVRFIPIYPSKTGVTDGSFSGFYMWGGPCVSKMSYVTPYVLSSRSATGGWKDLSGNENDGDLMNDASTASNSFRDGSVVYRGNMFAGDNADRSKSVNYLDFDGTDDGIEISSTQLDAVMSTSAMTVAVVYKLDATQSNPYPRIWDKGYALMHTSQTSPFALYVNVYDVDLDFLQIGASNISVSDEWVFVTWTWDGTTSSLYKNGALATSNTSGTMSGDVKSTSTNMKLGTNSFSGSTRDTAAQIGFFRVYSKALTATEVKANFNTLRNRFQV